MNAFALCQRAASDSGYDFCTTTTPSYSEGGLAPKLSTNPGPANTLGEQNSAEYWRQIRQGQSFTPVNPQMPPLFSSSQRSRIGAFSVTAR